MWTRPLSSVEAAFAFLHKEFNGGGQVCTLLTYGRYFSEHDVKSAINSVYDRFPILRASVCRSAEGLVLCAPRSKLVREEYEYEIGERDFVEDHVMAFELNTPLNIENSLSRFRIIAFPENSLTHIYWTRSHVISDGISTSIVMRLLLDVLCGSSPLLQRTGIYFCGVDALLPPSSTAHIGGLDRTHASVDEIPFRHAFSAAESLGAFQRVPINYGLSKRILDTAKARGFTISTVLGGIFAASVGECYSAHTLKVWTAMNVRSRLSIADSIVGCAIDVLPLEVNVAGGNLCECIRSYGASLKHAVETWTPLVRDQASILRSVKSLRGRDASAGIAVTNVGVLDSYLGGHSGDILEFRTVVNRSPANYAFVLHIASLRGKFIMSIAYSKAHFSDQVVKEMRSVFLLKLREFSVHAFS